MIILVDLEASLAMAILPTFQVVLQFPACHLVSAAAPGTIRLAVVAMNLGAPIGGLELWGSATYNGLVTYDLLL